ncbi:MAG: GTP 3',8-cyclase MoaA, partial [Solirubrobacteraceae bacterium]
MPATTDLLQRPLRDLRISVTDRCNLRCPYCMPREVFGAGFRFMERSELLSFEEIVRVARAGVEHGVCKVRLTGGEPLLRRELASLVALLAQVQGIEDIALTTNGTTLAMHAQALADAGLDRVTISLDALDEKVFHSMSDSRFPIARVLAGIDAAHDAGLSPVKINMVVRRGVNDHCVLEMAEHFRGRSETLRFIEYMDVGESNGWNVAEVVPASELIATIESRWALERLAPHRAGEVATRWAYRDGAGEIGVIHSVSQPFCGGCTRARLSADGTLYTCLFASQGTELRALLRGGADDAQLAQCLADVWRGRADRYSELRALRQGEQQPRSHVRGHPGRIEMSYI